MGSIFTAWLRPECTCDILRKLQIMHSGNYQLVKHPVHWNPKSQNNIKKVLISSLSTQVSQKYIYSTTLLNSSQNGVKP